MSEHEHEDEVEREPTADGDGRSTPVTQQIGRIAIVILAVLFGIFALANAQAVDFSWIFGETQVVEEGGERVSGGVPLILLLLISFAIGAAVATLVGWQRHRRHR
ncbi:MAG: hypothetical protein WEB03_13895 [Nitriliruptor sp.]|uniref:lipopolysaccharide assembly LapA domain-containing protein n=1 Tax=Nitriliruptor sp. TaxID=2448056 RepID=UPI0034A09E67